MQGQCGSLNVEELDEARSDEDDPINHAIWRVGGVFIVGGANMIAGCN